VLAARRDVFDAAGRFDERYPFEYEETEWEERVRAEGFDLRFVPQARVRHLWAVSSSRSPETAARRAASEELYRRRYGPIGRAILARASGGPSTARAARAARRARSPFGDARRRRRLLPNAQGPVHLSGPGDQFPPSARSASGCQPALALHVYRRGDGRPELASGEAERFRGPSRRAGAQDPGFRKV
jgi:hypothetical protein